MLNEKKRDRCKNQFSNWVIFISIGRVYGSITNSPVIRKKLLNAVGPFNYRSI